MFRNNSTEVLDGQWLFSERIEMYSEYLRSCARTYNFLWQKECDVTRKYLDCSKKMASERIDEITKIKRHSK